jgi:hypothetical protein
MATKIEKSPSPLFIGIAMATVMPSYVDCKSGLPLTAITLQCSVSALLKVMIFPGACPYANPAEIKNTVRVFTLGYLESFLESRDLS